MKSAVKIQIQNNKVTSSLYQLRLLRVHTHGNAMKSERTLVYVSRTRPAIFVIVSIRFLSDGFLSRTTQNWLNFSGFVCARKSSASANANAKSTVHIALLSRAEHVAIFSGKQLVFLLVLRQCRSRQGGFCAHCASLAERQLLTFCDVRMYRSLRGLWRNCEKNNMLSKHV